MCGVFDVHLSGWTIVIYITSYNNLEANVLSSIDVAGVLHAPTAIHISPDESLWLVHDFQILLHQTSLVEVFPHDGPVAFGASRFWHDGCDNAFGYVFGWSPTKLSEQQFFLAVLPWRSPNPPTVTGIAIVWHFYDFGSATEVVFSPNS